MRNLESMPVDLYQNNDNVVIKAGLPGVKTDEIQISLVNNMLHIRAEIKEEQNVEKATYHIKELRFGSMSRSISLPCAVNSEKAKAEFENGILVLTLPKAEEVKPKLITVNT